MLLKKLLSTTLLFGALAKLALALTMIGIFVIAYLWK